MRLLAWNIRQGGGSRLPRIADALKHHDADIVVLSEYRGGPSAPRLCAALHALGYRYPTALVPPPSRNGVLVAPFTNTAPSKWDCPSLIGWSVSTSPRSGSSASICRTCSRRSLTGKL